MRYLLIVIILAFSSFVLLGSTKGAQTDLLSAKSCKLQVYSLNKLSGPTIKAKIGYGKEILETIKVIPHLAKKSSHPQFLLNSRPDRNRDSQIFTLKPDTLYSANYCDYIFDFLYPKHVFW